MNRDTYEWVIEGRAGIRVLAWPLFVEQMMKSDRSGLVSLSQANAGSSSHLPKEVRAALRSPGRLEDSSSAPAYISSGRLLSRP